MGGTMTITESATSVTSSVQALLGQRRVPQGSWAPNRRGARLTLDIAVEVYGQGADGKIFHEETRTRVVGAHGALISLATKVAVGQAIVVVCKRNREEMHCRVVHQEVENGETHVGLAFATPSPKFWGVSFPSEDGDRTDRKPLAAHAIR
jgi:hypothetical protein